MGRVRFAGASAQAAGLAAGLNEKKVTSESPFLEITLLEPHSWNHHGAAQTQQIEPQQPGLPGLFAPLQLSPHGHHLLAQGMQRLSIAF